MDEPKSLVKPFDISKREVWEAWERVKANKEAPGVCPPALKMHTKASFVVNN